MSAEEKSNVAALAALFDCEEITIYKLAQRGVIPKPEKGQPWDIRKCTTKYIQYLRTRYSEGGKESRGRREKAEADMAEKENAKMDGALCVKADCLADMEDIITKLLVLVQHLAGPPIAKKILAEFKKIELPRFDYGEA